MRRPLSPHASTSSSYSIDEVRWLTLGDLPQAVHVLARNPAAPLLLFLHGGPGLPHMPFAYVNAELANEFVVVQWDQRGAGKTFCASPHRRALTLEQLIDDGSELVERLCRDFRHDRIVVVGHSCGSALGALITARCSRRIRSFVGVGQVTDLRGAEAVRYLAAGRIARLRGDLEALRHLLALGPPPYRSTVESDILEHVAATVNRDCLNPFLDPQYRWLAESSGLYTDVEFETVATGIHFSQDCLWNDLVDKIDLASQVPKLDVPVAFIMGGADSVAPCALAMDYFETLRAPLGKQFYRLAGLGHWPHLQAPRAYRAALRTVLGNSI